MPAQIQVRPGGVVTSFTFADDAGTVTVYTDEACTSEATQPVSVSTTTSYYIPGRGGRVLVTGVDREGTTLVAEWCDRNGLSIVDVVVPADYVAKLANLRPAANSIPARVGSAAVSSLTLAEGTVLGRAAGGDVGALTSAQVRGVVHGPIPRYLDAYTGFFGATKVYVAGQATTATTLTADVAAGATVLPVADASGLSAGVVLVTGAGTASQSLHVVVSVASLNVTVGAVPSALASGTAVTPLWVNSTHLTTAGINAFGYWVANHASLSDLAGKVTVFGNSWTSQVPTAWSAPLVAAHPSATVVMAGHAGDGPSQLIARFATDVPSDSDFVIINEPGVNSVAGLLSISAQAAYLETLVALIRGIGAIPVIVGHVPLSDYTTRASVAAAAQVAQVGDGMMYPAITGSGIYGALPPTTCPTRGSLGIGTFSMSSVTTGLSNVGVGERTGSLLSTGFSNTAVGYSALSQCSAGSNNTAVGQGALSLNVGSYATAVGQNSLVLATTGTGNTAVGTDSGYNVAGSTSDATVTGTYQTLVGYRSGAGAATSHATAIGSYAKASGAGSLAVGASASATASGAVAIGRDSAGTGAASSTQDEVALGTALHTVRIAGYLQIDRSQTTVGAAGGASALPATPTKYLSVKGSDGTEYVLPAYAKA